MAYRVSIVVLTYNQRETTLECLRALSEDRADRHDVVLWDNGSIDGTVAAVESAYPEIKCHYSDRNLGVASGRNAAAEFATRVGSPSHFLFLDNDIAVEPGFVDALLRPFTTDDTIGQTQAKLRFADDRERLNDGGGCDISFVLGRTRPVGFGEVDRGQYDRQRLCVACGGAMLVRADVFEQLGGFDSVFDPFGPEDLDFSLRLSDAGWKAVFVPEAVGYHKVSHTFGADYSAEYAQHKTRHWLLFLKRHAARWQVVAFYTMTAPWIFLRVVVRETARGNPSAGFGLLKGLWDGLSRGGRDRAG